MKNIYTHTQSGGTPETRNGLLEVQRAFREAGLDFSKQVLISGFNSAFFFLLYIMMAGNGCLYFLCAFY